jgi:hypothetical protein
VDEGVDISITVQGDYEPVAYADVTLSGVTDIMALYVGSTDGSGIATFTAIPSGSYDLIASATGYDAASKSITVSETSTSFTIQLAGGMEPVPIEEGYLVTVTTSVSYAEIALSGKTDFTYYSAVADAQGYARLENVKAGTYDLFASADGFYPASDVITVTESGNDFYLDLEPALSDVDPPAKDDDGTEIVDDNDDDVDDTTGDEIYTVVITVKDKETDAGVASCYVLIGTNTRLTDSSGEVIIKLTAGTYSVKIVREGYKTTATTLSVTQDGSVTYTVEKGDEENRQEELEVNWLLILLIVSIILVSIVIVVIVLRGKKKSGKR